ncbi:MAG: VRR-NUC domain-containing protein [Candidatus Merdivicinus sp.]
MAAILRHLKSRSRCFAWKTHGGMYGTAGIPDIIACVDGRFYAFEVKQPGGKLTRLQKIALGKIQAAGGMAVKVISVEEVKRALDGSPVLEAAAYWQQIRRLNTRINENLAQASQLRREGKIAEYVALEQEIDSDIDALVDLKERHGRPGKEELL